MNAIDFYHTMDEHLQSKFELLKSKSLNIDLTRGKPGADQLDLSNELLSISVPSHDENNVDLRNYGESDTVSSYDDLGLESYKDILGAFDFLIQIGFKSKSIGLHGISLGASTSIFAANAEPQIQAIWADSPLAEFKMILKDEIARYGLNIEFGPVVSLAGRILTGTDPRELSPAKKLSKNQYYFFIHGDSDTRILTRHF